MNGVNLFSQTNFFVFRNTVSALTPLQKRIVVIAALAFCLLATCYYLYANYSRGLLKKIDKDPSKLLLPKNGKLDPVVLDQPKSPLNQIGKESEKPTPKTTTEKTAPKTEELVPKNQPKQPAPIIEDPHHLTDDAELLIDADLEDGLSRFIESVQLLAPDTKRALTCTSAGVNYKIWWNSSTQAVNVQREENFSHQTLSKRQQEKVGIKESHGKFSYYVNNQPSLKGISQQQIERLKALLKEVEDVQAKYDEMKELESKFNPECLQLLLAFLKGAKGEPYRYHSSIAREGSKQLKWGKNPEIVLWMRINESIADQRVLSRFDQPAPSEKRYFINLQDAEKYLYSFPGDKIGIQVNEKGEIVSIYQDGYSSDASTVFSADAIWNKRLTEGINEFLRKMALNLVDQKLSLHSLTLSQIPEVVLDLLCKDGSFKIPNTVDFLKNTLEPGDGIDAGGLTRQFLSELPMYLLDGKAGRAVSIYSSTGFPKLSLIQGQQGQATQEAQTLQNFGMMLSESFKSNGNFVIGRVLPDHFFGLLKEVIEMDASPKDDQMISACQHIVSDENAWMWEVWKTEKDLSDDEVDTILNILCLADETDNPDDFESPGVLKKTSVKKILGDYLLQCYKPQILAALAISQGIADNQKALIKNLTDEELSERIQGEPFSRDTIANRVTCFSTNPVVLQKMDWLKEFIHTQPKEWVLKLLSTVTGERAVTAQTRIHLTPVTGIVNCHAHTCFKTLDVPTEHVSVGTDIGAVADDKQKFLNNLELTMSQDGFDFG